MKTFESSVNSEYSKTNERSCNKRPAFESSVNSEYSKTKNSTTAISKGLRVV